MSFKRDFPRFSVSRYFPFDSDVCLFWPKSAVLNVNVESEAPDVFCFPYENCIFKMAISVIFFGNLFVVSIEKCSLHHVGNL